MQFSLTSQSLGSRDLVKLRSSYRSTYRACLAYGTRVFLANAVGTLLSDTALLALMLVGVLRIRRNAVQRGITRVLYHQVSIFKDAVS